MACDRYDEVSVDKIAEVADSEYTDFVGDYVSNKELSEAGWGDGGPPDPNWNYSNEFARWLDRYLEDTGRSRDNVVRYAWAVGAREAKETDHDVDELRRLHHRAAVAAVADQRGSVGALFSAFSPFGHGYQNASMGDLDICTTEIGRALEEGFEAWRELEGSDDIH
ncbi:MAG: hypothetical protein ABEJ03_05550 [Candidatus Nanohaloarchaea archaeon]